MTLNSASDDTHWKKIIEKNEPAKQSNNTTQPNTTHPTRPTRPTSPPDDSMITHEVDDARDVDDARGADTAVNETTEENNGRDITAVIGRKVRGNWEIGVCVDGNYGPLLDDESIDEAMVGDEYVMTMLQAKWTKNAKKLKKQQREWVMVRLGTGSHESDVSYRQPGLAPAVVTESEVECGRDAQCVTKALALLDKTVILPPDVDFLSVPALLCNEPFKFVKPSKWGMPGLKGFENKPDGIELFCANAKPDEEYILRCHYTTSNTSLHCFAVKSHMIVDPSVGEWVLLSPENFARIGVTKILAGYRIVPKFKNSKKRKLASGGV